ncbi:MAG: sulfotransferase, partial [Candidatus Dadabacteria bacterium]
WLHRLMAEDSQFTYLKMYQTVLPSVLWYKIFDVLGWLDRLVGGWLFRLTVTPLNKLFFSQWEGVHDTGFQQSEEDEALWIYPWLTPAVLIFFPFIDQLMDVVDADKQPPDVRERINGYLKRSLQRHAWAVGKGRTLLAKNAVIGHRIGRYLDIMPEMRIIHLYRHPYASITSALSMFSKKMWAIHSPQCVGDTPEMRAAAELWCEQYLLLMELRDQLPPERYIEFSYDELAADPKGTVEKIYERFGLDISDEFRAVLEAEQARAGEYVSAHDYSLEEFGLDEDWLYERLKPAFERYGFERYPGRTPAAPAAAESA